MHLRGVRGVLVILLLCFPALSALAQSGRFAGQITDPQGAAIPGASIQVINQDTLVKREAESDASGTYSVPYLPAGKYQIVVSAGNFNTSIRSDVALGVADVFLYNVQLTVGAATTEVRVEGGGATEINVQNSEVSGTITSKEVANLALNGRNFAQLITLTPGVSNQSQQDEALVGPVGQAKYSFNGGRTEYNSFEVDGSDVLNLSIYPTSAPLIVTPSLDAIQEIKVITSNYGAEYGRTASGIVQVTTKSGTRSFHGNAYEFLRNELFNSRNYFDPPGSAPLYRRNDFGATLGGPIYIPHLYNSRKDRTYFFFSEEDRIDRTPTSYRAGAPSAAELKGDFSKICAQYPAVCPDPGRTQAYYLENAVDANMYAILQSGIIPAANATSGCNSSVDQCYVASVSPLTDWREELFRIDNDITSRHRLTLRYVHDAWHTVVLSPQWGYLGSQNTYPTIRNRFVGPGINALASLSSTLTQSMFNNLSFSYTDSKITLQDMGGPGVNLSRPAQLDSTTCTDKFYQGCPIGEIFANGAGGKIPGITLTGAGADFGGGNILLDTGYMPWEHTSPTYNLTDNLTKMLGKHTLQAGTQVILLERNQENSAVGSASGDIQGLITFAGISKNTAADLLAGGSSGTGISTYQQDSAQGRFHEYALVAEPYLQDDWRVTPRLTVNAGVRVSLFGNYYERERQLYNWEPSAFNLGITGSFHVDPYWGELVDNATSLPFPRSTSALDPRIGNGLVRCGYNDIPASCMTPQLWNPAPRVGFAWDITGRGTTALRGGYGMFYEHGTPYEANTGSLEGNPPAVTSVVEYDPYKLNCIGGGGSAGPCGNTAASGAFPISVTSVPTKTRWAYAQQWNVSLQQQFPRNFVVTAGYVGSKGTHLTAELQLNQLQPVPGQLNPFGLHEPLDLAKNCTGTHENGAPLAPQSINLANLGVVCGLTGLEVNLPRVPTAVRTFAPGLDKIASIQPIANSSYHAFQILARRTQGPLTIDAAYTFSHSIDDSSDRTEIPVNGLDISQNKASSSFDQRHLFEVSYVYRLPLAKLLQDFFNWLPEDPTNGWKPGWTSATVGHLGHVIADGWDLSGLTQVQTGIPFSVYNSGGGGFSAVDNAGVANGLSQLYASYPDLVASAKHCIRCVQQSGGDNPKSFGPLLLNPSAFAAPRGLTFGDAGRNVLNNPKRTNFDVSLLKHFALPHAWDLEFRAETFNLFNHTQFRIYDPSQGNSASNTVSCYADAEAHYSAAGGGGTDCYTGNGFLHPVNAHRARTMQFALKLAF